MIIPPSFPAGTTTASGLEVATSEVGALAGVRAVAGNGERQDEERASRGAGVVFEHSAMPPPLEMYGPDGKRVGEADAEAPEQADEAGVIEASDDTEQAEGPRPEQDLSAEDRQVIADMKARDAEVRAHEAAHVAAGGSYVQGGASFGFETGPDGKQYAVSGEVGIDTSPVAGDPQATADKARTVRAAALAPASPSGADRAIAAQASQMEAQAMVEIAAEQREQAAGGDGTPWDQYVQDHAPEGSTPANSFSLVA
jgi:hypothetical protein